MTNLHLHRTLYVAIFFAIIIAVFTAPLSAGPVKITGAEVTVFDQATNSFVFKGPVTISDGSTTIQGEYVSYKGKEEILEFRGPVSINQNGTTLSGKDLIYNVKKEEGSIKQALGLLKPAGAVSPVYVSGENVTSCKQRSVLEGARLTTCDPNNPGYYMVAHTIEIIPGDKLVLYNVKFIESGMTLFYWPRVSFSLKRADPSQASEEVALPKIGYSATEGWFVKSSFGYRGPGQQRGHILLDYMQLLGWGFGISHTLRADSQGNDTLTIYAQPNKNTGHTDVQLNLSEERTYFGNIRLGAHSSYASTVTSGTGGTGEQIRYENQINLAQDRKSGSTSLTYTDTRLSGVNSGSEVVGSVNHTENMGAGWKLRVNTNLHKRDRSDAVDRNLVGYLAEVTKDATDWSAGVVAEDRFNPDLAKDTPPEVTWSRAQRLPELTLKVNRLSLAGWTTPFMFDAAWGRLTENRYYGNKFSTERIHLAAKVKPLQLKLGPLGQLQWSGSAVRRQYGTGESHWVAGATSEYQLPVSKTLTVSGDYRYEQAFGDPSPFNFDRVTDQEKVQGRVEYHTDALQWSLTGGYDILTGAPTEAIGSIRLAPSSKLKLQAQGAYSLADSEWMYVVGTAQYTPDKRFALNLGAKYNVQLQRADRIDADFRWDLNTWQLGYTGIYDGINKKFDRGDFTITRDLGCRAIDLRYNQGRKEVWLEYRITAFPAASVKLGATEQHLMFDVRGWEEVLATE